MMLAFVALTLSAGVLSAVAALAAEPFMFTRRGASVRWVWLAAMLLTTVLPMVHLVGAANEPAVDAPAAITSSPRLMLPERAEMRPPLSVAPAPLARQPLGSRIAALLNTPFALPALSPATERAFLALWGGASAALALIVITSLVRLRRDTRRWPRQSIDGTPVLVSDGLGPALVGLVRPVVVVPPWVLALDAATTRTILAHEREHRRAGDVWVLTAAGVLVIAMPWHAMLWWMRHRLLRAVELDCDARVVAGGIAPASYAKHLVDAWQHASRSRRMAGVAAFAERPSELGQRVNHMLRPEPRRSIMVRVSCATMVVVLAAAAVALPTPQVAQAVQPPAVRMHSSLVVIDGVARPDLNTPAAMKSEIVGRSGSTKLVRVQSLDSAHAVALYGAAARRGATVAWTQGYIDRGGAVLPDSLLTPAAVEAAAPGTDVAAAVANTLLGGVMLPAAQESRARQVITSSMQEMQALRGPTRVRLESGMRLIATRDSTVRALITDPSQRATFDRNARAWSVHLRVPSAEELAETEVFNFLMDAPVTPAEFDEAVWVVEASQREELALYARAPQDTAGLRQLRERRVAAVRAVLKSDAARAAFDKRRPSFRFEPW